MAFLSSATVAYNNFLEEQPLLSQTLTMSAFCGLGDFLAQTNMKRTRSSIPYDWKRVARFLCKGIGCGILWSHWFLLAEAWSESLTRQALVLLPDDNDDVKVYMIARTMINLLLEQFIACPIIFGLWDLPIIALMDGVAVSEIPTIVRQKLLRLLIANAKLWTVVNVVIYNIPLNLRVLVVSIADLFWESIVSTIASGKRGGGDEVQEEEEGAEQHQDTKVKQS